MGRNMRNGDIYFDRNRDVRCAVWIPFSDHEASILGDCAGKSTEYGDCFCEHD